MKYLKAICVLFYEKYIYLAQSILKLSFNLYISSEAESIYEIFKYLSDEKLNEFECKVKSRD